MKTKMLIVEDEANTRQALVGFFKAADFQVCAAATGTEAIIAGAVFRPRVLLCDWRLDDQHDGLSVARALYRRDSSLAIIFVTARSTSELERLSSDMPGRRLMAKPVSLYELHATIDDMLALGHAGSREGYEGVA